MRKTLFLRNSGTKDGGESPRCRIAKELLWEVKMQLILTFSQIRLFPDAKNEKFMSRKNVIQANEILLMLLNKKKCTDFYHHLFLTEAVNRTHTYQLD